MSASQYTPIVEESMAEATQRVEQGEEHATTTPPRPTQARRTRGGRAVLLVVILLLGGGVGILAWQRLDMRLEEVQPATPVATQPTDMAIVNEQQLQQLTIEPVREQPVSVERDTTGRVSFNEEQLTPIYTPYAGRVLEVLANKGTEVRPGQALLVLEAPELVTVQNDLIAARSELAKAKIGLDAA